MCEVVEISDDEDSLLAANDGAIVPKDESLDYDLPQQSTCSRPGPENVASSSGSDLRSSFIGMGFAPSLVDKAIAEKGEGNAELVLETLFAYSQPNAESFDGGLFNGGGDDLAANLHAKEALRKSESSRSVENLFLEHTKKNAMVDFPLKQEPDVVSGPGVSDEKISSLLKMNFSLDEVRYAVDRLGNEAPICQLMDDIFAARMAKKYEKYANNSSLGDSESTKDCNNEALFGIMEKTLRLLEMGFTENEISAAFEKWGSEASLEELAESIVTGIGPNTDKYSSNSWSNLLKRKMGDCSTSQPFDTFIKTEESTSDVIAQVGITDLLQKMKGKMPKEEIPDESNNWKQPKEEFMEDPNNSVGLTWLEARKENSISTNNRLATSRKRVARITSLELDTKPTLSFPNPCRSLSFVVAKPPYFLYGHVTNLSQDSWAKISQFLYSLQPEFVNSQTYSALCRREGYVHNLSTEDRFHIFPKGPVTIEEAIPYARKCWPSWDNRKQLTYIDSDSTNTSYICDKLSRMMVESNGLPSPEQQRDLLQQCERKNLMWVGKNKLGPLEPEHLERIMGYPLHHSRVAGLSSTERIKLLKGSFQTDTLGYHLSVLRRLYPEGVTVLSFFTGIGGAEVALHRLDIRLKGVVCVEPCEVKRRTMKNWWENTAQSGELIQLDDIHKLSSKKLEELIKRFRGFDFVVCQNPNSGANSDSLTGLDFSMFAEFVRILQRVRSTMGSNR